MLLAANLADTIETTGLIVASTLQLKSCLTQHISQLSWQDAC